MMTDQALAMAKPYLDDEARLLRSLLDERGAGPRVEHCVVMGGVRFPHRALLAPWTQTYVAVDPQLAMLTDPVAGVEVRPVAFGGLVREHLPRGRILWLFHFNVLPYLDHPVATLERLARPGDLVVVSSWTASDAAEDARRAYLAHVFPSVASATSVGRLGGGERSLRGLVHLHGAREEEPLTGTVCELRVIGMRDADHDREVER